MNNLIKYLALVILFIVSSISIIPVVSGFEFDNLKTYDSQTQTLTVKNSIVGIPTTDVAKLKLLTPHHYIVWGEGYQKVAEIEIENYGEYTDALKSMEFYKVKDLYLEDIKFVTFDYKIKSYKNVTRDVYGCDVKKEPLKYKNGTEYCENELIGKETYQEEVWTDYKDTKLPQGKFTIGIFYPDVKVGEIIEWIPTFFGVRINEWADFVGATRTEWLNAIDTSYYLASSTRWGGQTFTAGWTTPGKLKFVGFAMKLCQGSATGLLTATLQEVNQATGLPTGVILSRNDTINYTDWPSCASPQWKNITMPAYDMTNATQYAVIWNKTTDGGNIQFRCSENNGAYKGGNATDNGAGTWVIVANQIDNLFEIYAEDASTNYSITLTRPTANTNISIVNFTCSVGTSNINITNFSLYINEQINQSNIVSGTLNYSTISKVITLPDGLYNWTCSGYNSNNQTMTTSTIAFYVHTTPPIINITYPQNTTYFDNFATSPNKTIQLNWTYNETLGVGSCWYTIDDGTRNYISCTVNTTFVNTTYGGHHIDFYMNDTVNNIGNQNVSFVLDYNLLINSVLYNTTTYETAFENYLLNISYSSAYTSVLASIYYNGTKTDLTQLNTGNPAMFSYSADIPLIEYENVNRSFFYQVSLYNLTGSTTFNTSVNNVSLNRIHLETCNATYTVRAINYTAYVETNLTRIDPFDFKGTFFYWLGSGTIYKNATFNNVSTPEHNLCIKPAHKTFIADAIISYDSAINGTYIERNFFYDNQPFANNTQNTSLYLLLAEDVTSFIIKVQEINQNAVPGAYVYIQRYYPETNTYQTVQVVKTDNNGQSIGFYKTETVYYRHIIIRNGVTELITPEQKIFGTSTPYTLTFIIGTLSDYPWSVFEDVKEISYSLTYNKTTKIVTYGYIDSSGEFEQARLFVTKSNLNRSNTIICNSTNAVSSSFIYCNISAYGNGQYTAYAYTTRDGIETNVYILPIETDDTMDIFGTFGLFLAMFILIICGTIFIYNQIAGIWLATISMIFVNVLGIADIGWFFLSAMLVISIIFTIILSRDR